MIDNIVFPGLQNGDFSHFDKGWFWEGPSHLALVALFSEAHFAEFLHLLDSTPPTTTPVVSPGPNANGWNKADVTVTLNAVDNAGGLGVQDIDVSLSGAQTGGGVVAGSGAAVDVLIEGITDITYFSHDFAGNQETPHVVTVRLDKTLPVVAPPDNQNVGQTTPTGALVNYLAPTVVENGSGLALSSCSPASGSTFALGTTTVTCTATDLAGNNGQATFTVTVNPAPASAPDARMYGVGFIDQGRNHNHFVFRVSQVQNHDYGRFEFWVNDPRNCRLDDEYARDPSINGEHDGDFGRNRRSPPNHFEATSIGSVLFSDDPAFSPGRGRLPTADTVTFLGAGKWNGRPGYTFEVRASDQGEPGRRHDTFSLVIKDSRGNIVVNVSGSLDGGNIQSTRLRR